MFVHRLLRTSVGRKYLMAVSGLSLVLFVIVHLLGNLSLYLPDGSVFNTYAHQLESLGTLLEIAEIGLVVIFILHFVMAILITKQNKQGRDQNYKVVQTKGGPSKSNAASRNMIVSGIVLLVFLIIHLWSFKYGPGIAEGYKAVVNGVEMRDLHRLVMETFKNPYYVLFYVVCMLFLGAHLSHGFWSAFQSLGTMSGRFVKPVYATGWAIAALLAFGFLFIPVWVYFMV